MLETVETVETWEVGAKPLPLHKPLTRGLWRTAYVCNTLSWLIPYGTVQYGSTQQHCTICLKQPIILQ